jgi:hypothetical protein
MKENLITLITPAININLLRPVNHNITFTSLKFTNQNLDLLQKKETSTRNNQVSPKMIADNCTVAGNYAKSGGSCSIITSLIGFIRQVTQSWMKCNI